MRMIHKYNIAELALVDRPIGGTQTGFGAPINRHPGNHDQRHFGTTNKDFYGASRPQNPAETVSNFEQTYNKQGGSNVRAYD
jgi:hypothetical protein